MVSKHRWFVVPALCTAALWLAACGGATSIGPKGGTATGPDGAQVVVPADALTSEVTISILKAGSEAPAFPAAEVTPAGAVFAFTPHGTSFAKPATLKVPFDGSKVPQGSMPALYRAEPGGSWAQVEGATVEGGFLVASVSGFSFYAPGTPGSMRFSELTSRCAREALSGNVYCWGDQGDISYMSGFASMMDGSFFPEPTRLPAKSLTSITGGYGSLCGLNVSEVWCIGADRITAASGVASPAGRRAWVRINVPEGVVLQHLSMGYEFVCGLGAPNSPNLDARGRVYCWGQGNRGQLGRGTTLTSDETVVPVLTEERFVALAAGGGHACAARQLDGEVFCWGSNIRGEVAAMPLGSFDLAASPMARGLKVDPRQGALAPVCGIKVGGATFCWGDNFYGQMGNGSAGTGLSGQNYRDPSEVPGLKFKAISTGDTMCGITLDDKVYCWGYGAKGSLGNGREWANPGAGGDQVKQKTPELISSVPAVTFQSLTNNVSGKCGRTVGNEVYCWGENRFYELGLGDLNPAFSTIPVRLKEPNPTRKMP